MCLNDDASLFERFLECLNVVALVKVCVKLLECCFIFNYAKVED